MPRLKNEGKTIPIPRLLLIISIKDFRVYLFQSIPDGPIKVKKPKRLKRRSTVSPRNQSGRSVKAQNNLLSCQCRLFSYSAQTGNKKEALIPALPFCLDISCFELNDFRWLLSQRVLDGFPDAIAGIGSAGNGIKIQILRSDQLRNELFCSPGINIRRFSLF